MTCRVDLTREFFRGLAIAVGLILLITGPFFAALKPWLGPALFALGAVLFLYGLRIPTRWCLSQGRLCLGRRCYDLARLKGYEVRTVGIGFCQEKRLYLVFEDRKVPFPAAVEGADRLALELFGEVPGLLRPPRLRQEAPTSPWRDELDYALVWAIALFAVKMGHAVTEKAGFGVALFFYAGIVIFGMQLLCLVDRRAKL